MARVTVGELLGEVLRHDFQAYSPSFALTRENGVEPIDIAKLAMACERVYRVTLNDEEIAEWHTLGDANAHVQRLLDAGDDKALARDDTDRTGWFYEYD